MSLNVGKIGSSHVTARQAVNLPQRPKQYRNSPAVIPPYHSNGMFDIFLGKLVDIFKSLTGQKGTIWHRSIWSSPHIPRETKAKMLTYDHYPKASWS